MSSFHEWAVTGLAARLAAVMWHGVGSAALLMGLAACGGGDPASPSSEAAPPKAQPAAAVTSVNTGVTDRPVGVFVAGSANGDAFVMWLTESGPRRQLWAVRYTRNTGQWSEPRRLSRNNVAYSSIALTADAAGNATAVWSELEDGVLSARFDRVAATWGAPVPLNSEVTFVHVAGNGSGVVHVVGTAGGDQTFDPAAGVWRPTGRLVQTNVPGGAATAEALALDESGHAVGLYRYASDFELIGSNVFSPATGRWGDLPPDGEQDFIGEVPGSRIDSIGSRQSIVQTQLIAVGQGDFIGAWNIDIGSDEIARIVLAKFSGSSRSWSTARTIVQVDPAQARLGTVALRSGGGNTFALWRQNLAGRAAVRVLRLDGNGIACDAVRTLDSAIGGDAEWPEMSVDARGNALAAWQQFDGTRNNLAWSRFDAARGQWEPAVLAESEPGDAVGARTAIAGDQALLSWTQREGNESRIKVTMLPLTEPPPR